MFVLLVLVYQVDNTHHLQFPHHTELSMTCLGLRCAEVLIERGVKVTILEGRDRIGGRVGVFLIEKENVY